MNLTHTLSTSRAAHFGLRVLAVTLLLIGGFALRGHPVSAATTNGTATITDPGSAQALASGGSADVFTVALPAAAACSGDTANNGYHVYSYFVPKNTAIGSMTFVNQPSTGYGFYDESGTYYGNANTAITTGQVINIPTTLSFAPLITGQIVPIADLLGTWEGGLVCANTSGTPTDWWNTEVTFTAEAGDANGFTWAATPGGSAGNGGTTTTTKPRPTPTTKPVVTPTTTGGTTATTAPTVTTIAGAGTTPTTIAVSGSDNGGITPIPVDASGGFSDPTAVSGTLPRTGSPVQRQVGLGLLAIGAGMMIIGFEWRWKARGAFAS